MKSNLKKFTLSFALMALAAPAFLRADNTGGSRPEDVLVKKVRHELVMLPYYNVFDILSFKVEGNTVTLMGDVTRPVLKDDAGRAVKHVEGVQTVVNNIRVLPLSPFDNQIRRAEYRAIYGYASLYRYALGTQPSIRIIVANGHVTLEGVVNNETDKNLVNIRANGVPGVFSVTNDLQVAHS
jgi:hyperosmotically inducible periplasmic protein